MKIIAKLVIILFLSFMPLALSVFSVGWDSKPMEIIDDLADQEEGGVQYTAVNNAPKTNIKDSLEGVKDEGAPYMQWMAYIGLGVALLAIIYNGFILLMNMGDKSKLGVVKKRLISITVGVVLVVSAYILLETVLSLIGNLTPA